MKRMTVNNYGKAIKLVMEIFPDSYITDDAMETFINLCFAMASFKHITVEDYLKELKKSGKEWHLTEKIASHEYIIH